MSRPDENKISHRWRGRPLFFSFLLSNFTFVIFLPASGSLHRFVRPLGYLAPVVSFFRPSMVSSRRA
jgi:hypothetical protein